MTINSLFRLPAFLLSAVLLLCSLGTRASHIAAVDLYVTYIGNTDPCTGKASLDYEVTLLLYAACDGGINFGPNDGVINWASNNAGFADSKLMQGVLADGVTPIPPNYSGDVVHQLCPAFDAQNSCNISANFDKYPAYRRWMFKTNITLNSAQSDWTFWWTSGARNGSIKNITFTQTGHQPQGNAWVGAGINNIAKADVSTPRFTKFPLPYICVNGKFKYLNGPTDVDVHKEDNELITYSQVPQQTNINSPYFYTPPYSAANPIGSSNGYFVNSLTGVAEFTPGFQGAHVLAFRCDKRDKNTGTLLAFTMRDVQVSVLDCDQAPPIIDSIPQQLAQATWKPYSERDSAIYVCPGSTMSFNIMAYNDDPDKANKLYWETNIAELNGSAFSSSGEGTDTIRGTFTWTPDWSDVKDHTLEIIAKDSTCDPDLPIILYSPSVFIIRVTKGLDAGPDLTTCQFNPKGHQVFVKGTEYKLRVEWSALDGAPAKGIDSPTSIRPTIFASGYNEYLVKTPDLIGQCKARDTLVLKPDESNTIDVFPDNPIILCRPDYLQLDAKFVGKAPLKNMRCGTDSIMTCTDPDSVTIFGSPAYDRFITFDTLGPSSTVIPNDVSTSRQQFLITKNELRQYGLEPSTIRNIAFEVVSELDANSDISNFTISMACTDKKSLSRSEGFVPDVTTVYAAPGNVKFTEGWHNFELDKPYNWDTTKNLIIQVCFGNDASLGMCNSILRFVPTSYTAMLKVQPPDNSLQNFCATNTSPLITEVATRPLIRLFFCNAPVADMEYVWTPGTFLSDSTILQPLAYVPKSAKYVLQTMGRNGCKLYDTADIYVPVHNYTVMPVDTAICFNEGAPMRTAGGGFTFKWYKINDKGEYEILSHTDEASCWNCADPVLKPLKTTTYKIAVYDSVWCIDTLTAKITVKPLPDIKILNRDTAVKYGQSIQLMASGARIYNWSPVGSLSNANTSFPVATPTEPTTYIAGGIGANGCRAFDTLNVSVDYRDNLFVPSGFSPNNDGKNDVLKVTNLTFQRVIEFRVFNRWGQEVFMANDNRGWDGAWKGEPQDMDSYTYNIKIAFPDGYIETYRGTTTLIR